MSFYGLCRAHGTVVNLTGIRLFIFEWNMGLMRPNLATRFQPCIVQLDPAAPVNNIKVIHFGRSDDLGNVPLKLKSWDVRWIEIE
jgi:hypothetical protein